MWSQLGVTVRGCDSDEIIAALLAPQLSDGFFDEFRYRPSPSEVTSWRNSLGSMASVLQFADLTDQWILVELKLPLSSKRLDVVLTGSNRTTGDSAVVVELKQWTEVGHSKTAISSSGQISCWVSWSHAITAPRSTTRPS